jgi:hypothetical protein
MLIIFNAVYYVILNFFTNSIILDIIRLVILVSLDQVSILLFIINFIGDSGYPIAPWLMTPVAGYTGPNTPEDKYNRCLTQARSSIERCIGVLKSRWRCLLKHRVLHYMPDKASKIVNACAILHNMCVEDGLQFNQEDMVNFEDLGVDIVPALNEPGNQRGRDVRERIIATHFS